MLRVDKLFSLETIDVILSNPYQVELFTCYLPFSKEWRTDKDLQYSASAGIERKY